jgi:signal transduction histidine kinase
VQLAKSLIKFARRLGKREKSKAKYVEKLKQKNQQISDVIDAISHEFKNPVAAIMGYAQTVRDDPQMNPKLHARFMQKIFDNGQVISDLIDRLALSLRFENDTVTLAPSTFNLVDILTQASENLEQKYQNRHVVIVAPPTINVVADRSMIFQIITNLVDNGLKYSKENVNIVCHCTKKSVSISVIDQGIGIDAEHLELITKKFYRVDRYSWDNSLGIGLALVEYMVKLHHSHLEISSQIGVGSTFSFKLPTKEEL